MSFNTPTFRGFSPIDWYCLNAGTAAVDTAGDWTSGCTFRPLREITINGIRIFWNRATLSETLNVKLWNDADAAAVASASVVTTGAGYYEVLFSSPYTIPSNRVNYNHYASYRITGGTRYMVTSAANSRPGVDFPTSLFSPPGLIYTNLAAFIAGDAKPTSVAVTNRYPCEPIVDRSK